ncbi:NAD(P)-binding protein [Aaosphaeria arxii CBS 175.79]|uniref:NAD(P)-binding protein n=1 Tax=Aaosphaeria arxii CBS 175.79 TaxID=1450172 RepID=A0A6A5XPA6_9PLEO|nr:NAD(P)-binding protein [Aaosphaeria arxii CBS 175.79]KAF2015095.1 NAD(P)-binding protein [Aaosphaeria arxii CBS 175.79]
MITVAVAGGTSPGLGRSILEALINQPERVTPIVLSRETSKTPKWLSDLAIEVRRVNYQSPESLDDALNGVHTVISTLLAIDGTWASTQLSLLSACIRAGVSRFAPAEFGLGPLSAHHIALVSPQVEVMNACREAKLQNPATFEYAGFHPGLFMNYLGYGAPDQEEALHGFEDNWEDSWFHVNTMKAEIPLTKEGEVPRITMTELRDVGRFVAAACLLPDGFWQEDFSMVGETLRMDEIVKVIEKVKGGKVEVMYRKYDELAALTKREENPWRKFWYELEGAIARDTKGEAFVDPILNGLFPDIKPVSIEEYLTKYWT